MTHLPDDVAAALTRARDAEHDRAWAMPGSYYTSEDMLAVEKSSLFAREWICVGRADELPEPGDYLAIDIVDEPVAIVRGQDGTLRALSNVCRHRGLPILEGTGRAGRLVCPYHAWTYDLRGQLIGTPRMPKREDFDKAECPLPEFALEVWQGFVFVSLNPNPPPLVERLAPLTEMIGNYHFEGMKTRYTAFEVWNTNWKSLVENFMEGYHLTPLHKETLHPVNPTELCAHYPPGEAHFGCFAGFSPDMERVRRGHPDLSDKEIDTCVMIAVPPNLLIGGASDYSSFLCIEPLETNSVRVKLGLFFHGDDWSEADVDRAVVLFQETMAEDKTVLDQIARGLRSSRYRPGPLAPAAFEGCIVDLQKYLARRLLDAG